MPSPANFQEVEKIFIRYYTAMMADEVSIADGVKQADAELERLVRPPQAAGSAAEPLLPTVRLAPCSEARAGAAHRAGAAPAPIPPRG